MPSELVKLFSDEAAYVRATAVESLGKLGDSSSIPALIKLLKDEDMDVQRFAAYALGDLGERSVVPELVNLLVDASVRQSVAESLGKLGERSVELFFSRYFNNRERRDKTVDKTAKALISMNAFSSELYAWQEEQFKVAQEYFKKNKKRGAANVLGYVFTEESVTLLSSLLADTNQNVVKLGVESIGRIGEYYPGLVQTQTEQLLNLTAHENFELRRPQSRLLASSFPFIVKSRLPIYWSRKKRFVRFCITSFLRRRKSLSSAKPLLMPLAQPTAQTAPQKFTSY